MRVRRFETHTIKEAIHKCHVQTKKLDDWLEYEHLVGADESFAQNCFPTTRISAGKGYEDEAHPLLISCVHGNTNRHTRGFLLVH